MSSFDRAYEISASWSSQMAMRLILFLGVTALASHPALAENQSPARGLDVAELQLVEGIEIPADYVEAIQAKSIHELGKSKAFNAVQKLDAQSQPTQNLQLTWTVTHFDAGSRTKRIVASYTIGKYFGVGATRMIIHIQLRDPATNTLLLDKDVEGAMKGDSIKNPLDPFSSSKRITDIEAKNIAKAIRKSVHD